MSSKRCCVPLCPEIEDSQTVLHWFPKPEMDIARFQAWVHAIGGEILSLSNENIYKLRRVCHAHFERKYCCRNNRISKIAVPTLLMPGLSISKFTHTDRIPFSEIVNVPSTSKVKMLKNKRYVYGEGLEVPCHLNFGKEMLDRMVEFADYPALINADNGDTVTFIQLAQQTVDIALSLSRMGVGKGDVVSICSEKQMEVMATILGVFCVGATFSPTDITYGTVPLLHRVKIARPKYMFISSTAYDLHKIAFDTVGCIKTYIIYGDENKDGGILFKDFLTVTANVADFLPAEVDGWKDLLLILFSSGTTGLPKGVPWTHLGFLTNSVSITHVSFKYSSILITREWYYSYGLLVTLSCLKRGTTVVFSPRNGETECMQAIEKYKVRILQSAPTSITQLIKSSILDNYDLSSVEVIMSSSTPVMKEQVEAVKRRFPALKGVYQLYGTTEAGNTCSELYAPFGPRDGSVGTPSHGFVFKVVGLDTREPLGPNERGEICFKSPSLTPGYLGIDNLDHLDDEGFYKSGDVGYYDEDRYFYVINRVKELIKYNDISIAPAELESILLRHPFVLEAGVAGIPQTGCGEAPTAAVVLSPGQEVTEEEIAEFLHSRITFRMKLAGGVRFVDQLPRGAGDKLDRHALKQMLS